MTRVSTKKLSSSGGNEITFNNNKNNVKDQELG